MVRQRYIVGVCIFILSVVVLIAISLNVEFTEKVDDSVVKEYTVTTKLIEGEDIYEVRLYNFETDSVVYKNNIKWLEVGYTGDIGKYKEFSLKGKGKKIKVEEYKTSIEGVYKIDCDNAKNYIKSLLDEEYTLEREVMTENSVDIYIKNKKDEKEILRIIVLADRMIKMKYDGNELPDIKSYFK